MVSDLTNLHCILVPCLVSNVRTTSQRRSVERKASEMDNIIQQAIIGTTDLSVIFQCTGFYERHL